MGSKVTGSVNKVELSRWLTGLLCTFCNCRVNEMGAWSDTVLVPIQKVQFSLRHKLKVYAAIFVVDRGEVGIVFLLWVCYPPGVFQC